jgi:nucleoside-diphosphate-sugar epimerase
MALNKQLKACVIGANGLIGQSICRKLVDNYYSLTAIARATQSSSESVVYCQSHADLLKTLEREAPFDLIVDLRAYCASDLIGLPERARFLTDYWVHVSTIYVYRRLSNALAMRAQEDFLQCPIPEDMPCRPEGTYGKGKLECEQKWSDAITLADAPVTIVRLPFIFGPFDRSERIRFYIDRLLADEPIRLPNAGRSLIDLLYSEDLAQTLLWLTSCSESTGNIYNIGRREVLSLFEHLTLLAEVLGKRLRILESGVREDNDVPHAPFAYPIDIYLDTSRLYALLGDVPTVSHKDSWEKTVEWELTRSMPRGIPDL